jgi:hypothetical protein
MVFYFFEEKGEDPRKGVSKANYGGRGCAAQHRGSFYGVNSSFLSTRGRGVLVQNNIYSRTTHLEIWSVFPPLLHNHWLQPDDFPFRAFSAPAPTSCTRPPARPFALVARSQPISLVQTTRQLFAFLQVDCPIFFWLLTSCGSETVCPPFQNHLYPHNLFAIPSSTHTNCSTFRFPEPPASRTSLTCSMTITIFLAHLATA